MPSTTSRPCSIARSLDVLGERWTLLAIRELVFGVRRFDGIARATGAPRDVLTKRLRGLEDAGLVVRRPYSERPPRFEYHLTELGREASEVLLLLMRFGDRHLTSDVAQAPVVWAHGGGPDEADGHGDRTADHVLDPLLICRSCGRPAGNGMHDPRGPGAPGASAC